MANSVSGKTTGLVVGEDPGASKLTKARKAEVPVLSEDDLRELLSDAPPVVGPSQTAPMRRRR